MINKCIYLSEIHIHFTCNDKDKKKTKYFKLVLSKLTHLGPIIFSIGHFQISEITMT